MADPSGRPQSSGVARRRRERRLRSMLRHERMTVAMALAEFSRRSSWGQRMARLGCGGTSRTTRRRSGRPPHPSRSSSASKKSPAGACQHLCLRSLAGRRRWSGTSWSIWPSLPPWCKSSMLLCRRHLADPGFPDCRAGYRCAQDLLLSVSIAFSCSCAAVSGTVGGSADRVVSHAHRFVDRGADRRHSSSSGSCSRFSPRTEFNSDDFFFGTHF